MVSGVGIGSFFGGVADGQQEAADLAQKAVQIKQYQVTLDQAKKQLVGRAIAFKGLGGFSQPQMATGGQGAAPPVAPQQSPSIVGGGQIDPQSGFGQPSIPQNLTPPMQGFAGAGLQPGVSQGPQPPMPGQSSAPAAPPVQLAPPPQAPVMPGPQAAPVAGPDGQGGPPAAAASPPGPQASSSILDQPPPNPSQEALGLMDKMYKGLKAANPGADDETLSYAMEHLLTQMKGLSPDMRAQMSYMLNAAREQGKNDRQAAGIDSREGMQADKLAFQGEQGNANRATRVQVGTDRNTTSRENTQDRVGATERGQDLAHTDRQDAIGQRADAVAARIDASSATAPQKAAYKKLMANRTLFTDQMAAEVPGSDRWNTLSKQKQAVDNQVLQLYSSSGQALPAPKDIVAVAKAPPAAAAPPRVTTQAQFNALPPGAVYISTDGKPHQKPK